MKLFYCFCFCVFALAANGQKPIKGVVLNKDNKPIPNASVFINTSSIETTSDELGNFAMKIPAGRCAIVIASAGFETYSQIISSKEIPDRMTVTLQTKPLEKNTYEKNGWTNWGNFFMLNFIGSSANAHDCKLKNPKAIHFSISEERNELSASTDEPLIIENKALGYTIKYYLESFVFNFQTLIFGYKGYCFFQPMQGGADKQNIWEKNRSETYTGSLMHFMRSLYRNQIEEEGFDVRPLKKVKNLPSYQTNKTEVASQNANGKDSVQTKNLTDTDEDYQEQITNEDNYRDILGTSIRGDSIAYAVSETTAGLDFKNFIMVTYRGKETPPEYQQQMNGTSLTSQLILINKRPVEIESNGSYYDTRDLLVLGYWTWSQKIANILPYDYNPLKAK